MTSKEKREKNLSLVIPSGTMSLHVLYPIRIQIVSPSEESPPSPRTVCCLSIVLFSFAISSSAANSLFYTLISLLAAEFHNHSVDFVDDVNNYQVKEGF